MSAGATLAEAKAIYESIRQTLGLMDQVEAKVDIQKIKWFEYRRLIYETIDILDHLGFGETMPQVMDTLRTTMFLVNMLHVASLALAASPAGAIAMAIGMIASTFALVSTKDRRGRF